MALVASLGHAAGHETEAAHVQRAKQIAGARFSYTAAVMCGTTEDRLNKYHWPDLHPLTAPAFIPTKVFDDLYYIGTDSTNIWALNTPDGIVLFDALFNDEMSQRVIVAGLRRFSLDPARVRYVVVLHGHIDMYGGARYFQRTYGSKVVMSSIDWDYLEGVGYGAPQPEPRPARDIAVMDGQSLSLGGITVRFVLTPGHTAGAMEAILPVTDHGVPHTALILGGLAVGGIMLPNAYPESLARLKTAALASKVDVVLTAHPVMDGSIPFLKQMQNRSKTAPNPFILGVDGVQTFLDVIRECTLASISRPPQSNKGPDIHQLLP